MHSSLSVSWLFGVGLGFLISFKLRAVGIGITFGFG